MRPILAVLLLAAGPAAAHPGHLAGVAGHDHWVAGAAIGLAIALGLWGALKGRESKAEEPEEAEAEEQSA
ncbi:DUF6732 family protein [Wenxinia marina]|uniref:Wenxma_21, whole genome shotgun sequence n=1 Tax=Wenxinia marina DSM 24838 TaxID=1123501 RepID=A0A0D0NGR1_9RHOB|nr:DUF6732 family protein [Wenxinia marina]KIQ67515.1 hypothetical protein Wenmar_03940 [Wenxinia marina DSM 24838]GGL68874.1 hypothetical protein GCM10011392_24180 [Wenxinia marina]